MTPNFTKFSSEPRPRFGDWIQTFTGKKFWVLDAREEDVDIRDIAHALANTSRFGGHTERPYSVAQHSVWVSRHCPKYPLIGLLHDAAEAYLGDMVKPLKGDMLEYQRAEANLWAVIADKFRLPNELPEEVKVADRLALVTERRDLMKVTGHKWHPTLEALEPDPEPIRSGWWAHRQAEKNFLAEFARLTKNGIRVNWLHE
jgi:hypothetical protein